MASSPADSGDSSGLPTPSSVFAPFFIDYNEEILKSTIL